MKAILIAIVVHLSVLVVSAQDLGIEKGWKGIKLFETAKADLEKILGPTSHGWESLYTPAPNTFVDWALANVAFSKGPCVAAVTDQSRYNIEKDRIVGMSITFGNLPKFSDQKLQQKYTRKDNANSNGGLYSNPDGSIQIWTMNNGPQGVETVFTVYYLPTSEQKTKYKCS